MPHLTHLALWVADFAPMLAFYTQYFGASVGPKYENPAKGFESYFLSFSEGARLELMRSTTLAPVKHAPGAQRMGLTHFAIAVGSEARVDELTRALQQAGHPILDGPRRTGDGYYESVVLDPEGNRVEITV